MRLKAILIAFLALLVAVLGGAVVFVMSIDFNQYKGLIARQVERATGRALAINGKIELALSLTPTLDAEDLSLANAPGGSRPAMITVKRLEVQLHLLPLLSGKVEIDRVVLDGADVLLETGNSGRGNWVFNPQESTAAAPATAGSEAPLPEIGLVQIRNSHVTYHESSGTRSLRIETLDAETRSGRVALDLAATVGKAPITVKGSIGAPALLAGGAPYPFDLLVVSGATSATIKGAIGDITEMKGLVAEISAEGQSLSELNGLADVDLPSLGPYSLAARAVDIPGGYKLNPFTLRMGGSRIGGDVVVTFAQRPKVIADLSAERVDLKDFSVAPEGRRAGGGPDDGRVFPADPLPFAALTQVDADLKLAAGQLVRGSADFHDVKLAAVLTAGRLAIRPLSADIEGGRLAADITVDANRVPAAVTLDLTNSNAEAGRLLQLLTGAEIVTGGRANLKITASGSGNSLRALMAGVSGTFDYDMGAGNIDNAYAKIFLADLFTLLSFGNSGSSSNVKCIAARFDVSRGLATSRQLAMETKGAIILGKGTINLATERLDIHLVPYATSANLANFTVPMVVEGSVDNPRVTPDAAAIAKGAVGTVVTAPLTALNALGGMVGIGGGGDPAHCGAAAAAPGKGLLEGVGSGAKDAVDRLKGLLP
jgi:AsmA family protein